MSVGVSFVFVSVIVVALGLADSGGDVAGAAAAALSTLKERKKSTHQPHRHKEFSSSPISQNHSPKTASKSFVVVSVIITILKLGFCFCSPFPTSLVSPTFHSPPPLSTLPKQDPLRLSPHPPPRPLPESHVPNPLPLLCPSIEATLCDSSIGGLRPKARGRHSCVCVCVCVCVRARGEVGPSVAAGKRNETQTSIRASSLFFCQPCPHCCAVSVVFPPSLPIVSHVTGPSATAKL